MTLVAVANPAFLDELSRTADGESPAVIDAETAQRLTYSALRTAVDETAAAFVSVRRRLAFLLARNDVATIVALFALRSAGHVVAMVDASLDDESLRALIASYDPELVVESEAASAEARPASPARLTAVARDREAPTRLLEIAGMQVTPSRPYRLRVTDRTTPRHERYPELHASLALCLATSGSTGSPKFVRLSQQAVVANAQAIAGALSITNRDRAITCLPLHYAYGLSILTSHFAAGASVVVTGAGLLTPELWQTVRSHDVSTLAAVPYGYEMLVRLGFDRTIPSCVRVMTQAGGKLSNELVTQAAAFMRARGGRFHVMYGQTEATARIAIMPSEWLPDRIGMVGRAVPGGTLEACDEHGHTLPAGVEGEIRYRGPNVMLGYATDRAGLACGDTQRGELRTGDVGIVDADGCLRITGRLKRMGKLFGVRVDLDAVEQLAAEEMPVAIIDGVDRLILFAATTDAARLDALRRRIASRLKVQQRTIEMRVIDAIPRTSSGKVDYPKLRAGV